MKDKEFELMFEELLKKAFESKPREIDYCFTPGSYAIFHELIMEEAKREGFIIEPEPDIKMLNPRYGEIKSISTQTMSIESALEVYKDILTEKEINKLKSQIK